jgi:hypothetical protein
VTVPTARVCACGRLTTGARCRVCEHERNQQPTRVAHRTPQHRRVRTHVLARDQHVCRWCGGRATECDYIVALAHGGAMSADNAVASCKRCNATRGATVRRT